MPRCLDRVHTCTDSRSYQHVESHNCAKVECDRDVRQEALKCELWIRRVDGVAGGRAR